MSSSMTPDRLRAVVVELLESAVFIFTEPAEPGPWTDPDIWCGRLEMGDEDKVDLFFCVPKALGIILASNLLGTEPDAEETSNGVRDAVGEMANMLAGILVVELYGRDVISHIAPPQVYEETGVLHDAHNAQALSVISLRTEEGHRIDVSLVKAGVVPVVSANPTPTPAPAGGAP